MAKQEPLKYRVISSVFSPVWGTYKGVWTFRACLANGFHVVVAIAAYFWQEYAVCEKCSERGKLPITPPKNPGDHNEKISFYPCDCNEHHEKAPAWLAEALVEHQASSKPARCSRAKPKKRPTMGPKR